MNEPVVPLREAVKTAAAEDRTGWTPLALSDRVRDLLEVSESMQVELVRGLADWDGVTTWAEDGALTPVSWLCANARLTKGEAAGLVRLARLYAHYQPVRVGLDGGRLSLAHARVLARAEKGREDTFADCVDGLVELAAELSVRDFAQVMAAWIEQVDDKAPFDDSTRAWRSGAAWDGKANGQLTTSADEMAIIDAVIDHLDTPDPADCPEGPRTRSQRAHDIMIDVFRRVLADEIGHDPDPIGGADIVVDADTAAAITANPDTEQPELALDAVAERRCEHTETAQRATLALAAALICTGWVRKILIDPATGNVLDSGRRHRLFTRRQRRALVYRDRGCVFPGCDRKPRWCDAHHLKPWDDRGLTDLINGVLLCRRHHGYVHNGWKLERDPLSGIVTATSPDGRQFTRRPGERC